MTRPDQSGKREGVILGLSLLAMDLYRVWRMNRRFRHLYR